MDDWRHLPLYPTAAEQARMSAAISRVTLRYHERFMAGEGGAPDLLPLDRDAIADPVERRFWQDVREELRAEFSSLMRVDGG